MRKITTKFSLLLLFLILVTSCSSGQRVVQKCKRTDVIYDYLVHREIQKNNLAKIDSLNTERNKKITKYTKEL